MAAKKAAKKKPAKKAAKKSRARSVKKALVVKTVAVSPGKVDADVREAVGFVTGVSNFTKAINSKYLTKPPWIGAGERIEFRLVEVHGYATFQLNHQESGNHYNGTFSAFIIFCRNKILAA